MEATELSKCLLGKQYNASIDNLATERAKARKLLVELNQYAGSYLNIADPVAYAKYMQLRKQCLPNVDDSCIFDNGIHVDYGSNIYCKAKSIVSFNCTLLDSTGIYIGEHVYIGPSVVLSDISHPMNATERALQHGSISKPIVIEDMVWICSNATICQGVRLGHNSVVGANTCVRHNVPPHSFVRSDGTVVADPTGEYAIAAILADNK